MKDNSELEKDLKKLIESSKSLGIAISAMSISAFRYPDNLKEREKEAEICLDKVEKLKKLMLKKYQLKVDGLEDKK